MIKVKNLVKTFINGQKQTIAVNNLSFNINAAEFVTVTGKSGSGKSTLLYQLGLLDHPTSGEIFIDGIDTHTLNQAQRTTFRLNYLGYVFQDYALIPSLTALENIQVPLIMSGFSLSKAAALALESLEKVGLQDHHNKLPSQLSGGQQQRVSIARAISHNPKILFADEPTANLDSETSEKILKLFLQLNKQGQTIIMVTHEPEYAKLSHRELVMRDGFLL